MIFHNYWSPFIEFNNNIMIIILLIKLILFDAAVPVDERIGEKEVQKVKSEIASCGTQGNSPGSVANNLDKLGTRTSINCSKNVLCYEQQGLCVL